MRNASLIRPAKTHHFERKEGNGGGREMGGEDSDLENLSAVDLNADVLGGEANALEEGDDGSEELSLSGNGGDTHDVWRR